MQHGIPSVMFITWPDMWHHSSQDTPDKLDPTQFKRATVVGTGAMSALASAEDEMAMKVASESLARGAERKGAGYPADATSGPALLEAYKEAHNAVRHQAEIEKAVVGSAAELFTNPTDGQKKLTANGKLNSLPIGDSLTVAMTRATPRRVGQTPRIRSQLQSLRR